MLTPDILRDRLAEIAGKGYTAYRALLGVYDFGHYQLALDNIQKDPFASPTRARLRVPLGVALFPRRFVGDAVARTATADWLARRAVEVIERLQPQGRAPRTVAVDAGAQTVLSRSAAAFSDDFVELRLNITLPGEGRTVVHQDAEDLFYSVIPQLSRDALLYDGATSHLLRVHVESFEDQRALRDRLEELSLVAFVADGSILPRASGASDLPMDRAAAVPCTAPRELAVTVELPNAGEVQGLGIPRGITVVVGGGFHGKSTLLRALEMGVYDHVPGDGRELVVTEPTATLIRAEEGRPVSGVDIRAFFRTLPGGQDTEHFSTQRATGATSQAVNILEAIEAGGRLLLLDEDTCATNFMVRDARMRELVSSRREPIIPFVDRVGYLRDELGVSTVLVMGGCGDYLDPADTVILMDHYVPKCVTKQARAVARKLPTGRVEEAPPRQTATAARSPQPHSIHTRRGRKPSKVSTDGLVRIVVGTDEIDLSAVSALVDPSQVRAIADAIEYACRSAIIDGRTPISDVATEIRRRIGEQGLDCISPHVGRHPGDYADFRALDFAAALNRLPTLSVDPAEAPEHPELEDEEDEEPEAETIEEKAPPGPHEPAAPEPRKRSRRSRRKKGEAPEAIAEPTPAPTFAEEVPEPPRPARRLPRQRPTPEPRAPAAAPPTETPGPSADLAAQPEPPEEAASDVDEQPRKRRRPARRRRKKPQPEAQEPSKPAAEAPPEPAPLPEAGPTEAGQTSRKPRRRRGPRRRKAPTSASAESAADH